MGEPSPPSAAQSLGADIIQRCLDAGFDRAGIATLEPIEHRGFFEEWLASGKHGTMDWLASTLDVRANPVSLLEGARAAVMVADHYAHPDEPNDPEDPMLALVARYARADDYHKRLKRRLKSVCDLLAAEHPGSTSRVFTDSAPVPERELAQRAGLGWTGKHTLAIDPRWGSWFVLGGFLTTLDVRAPTDQPTITDHCGTCTRCVEACPTGAITPYSVDASRCISYLTIEHDGPIEPKLAAGIGQRFAGCDVCQEVCPHNRPRVGSGPSVPPETRTGFDLLDVLGWDEQTRRARFASSALKRVTLARAHRNAAINARHALRSGRLTTEQTLSLRQALDRLAWNPEADPVARQAAREALAEG